MQKADRRGFIKLGGAVLATGLVTVLRPAHASDHANHMEHGGQLVSEKGADASS